MEFSSIEISSKAYLCKFILFGLEQKLVSFPYSRKNCILELTSSKVRSISKSKTTNEENRHYIKRENNGIMETVEKINDTKILIEVVRLPFKFRASFILPLVGINCTTSEVFRGIYFLLCHHAKG